MDKDSQIFKEAIKQLIQDQVQPYLLMLRDQSKATNSLLTEIATRGLLGALAEKMAGGELKVETIKGDKGDDSKPEDVAAVLKSDKDFLSKVKGQKGDAADAAKVAQHLAENEAFKKAVQGEKGADANTEQIIALLKSDIAFLNKVKGDKGDTKYLEKAEMAAEEIRNKLEGLSGGRGLSIKALSGVREMVIEIINELGILSGIGGSGNITGATTLAGLSDVEFSSLTDGQFLKYNGTTGKWYNATSSGGAVAWADITGDQTDVNVGGFTNDAGYITSAALSPYATIASLASVAFSGAYADLTGAPTNVSAFTNDAGYLVAADVHNVPAGGTTGQVLAKVSNTDYDLEWATVSGGGGSPVGGCGAIQFADNTLGTSFCGEADFNWEGTTMRIGPSTDACRVTYDYNADGHQVSFINPTNGEAAYFGWADGETPYTIWGCDANSFIKQDNAGVYTTAFCSYSVNVLTCPFIDNKPGSNCVMFNGCYSFPNTAGTAGQFLQLCSGADALEWVSVSPGGATSSGGAFSLQFADGASGFCDAGVCNGENCFQYQSGIVSMLGWDFGDGISAKFTISNTNCDGWDFNSTSTCPSSHVLPVRFNLGCCGTTFSVTTPDSMSFIIDPTYNCLHTSDSYGNASYFGITCCGAAVWSQTGASFIAGYNATCSVRIMNGTYNDYIHFEDYQTGFSGVACDLLFTINNGCNYGYTQIDLGGLGCGGVLNSNSGDLLLAQANCAGLCIGASGFMTSLGTLNINNGLCIGGNAPAADNTYSSPTSITIQCGIITAIS